MKTQWQTKKISEIAEYSLGKMLDKAKNRGELKPYLRNFNVRWFDFDLSDMLKMRFLPEDEAKYTAVKGDVLVCEGGYPGRAAIWTQSEPIYFQKALHRVRFHESERNKWFLYYLLAKDLDGTLRNHFRGAGIQHFTGEALAEFEMPIPPLPEQQRIIGILDKAFAAIATTKANTEKNLQNARALFESELQVIFTENRDGWSEKPLGALAEFRNGINYTQNSKGERIQVVGVKDFKKNFWVPSDDLDTVSVDDRLADLDLLKSADLLLVRSNGNPALIGRCMLANGLPKRISHSGFTIRVRLSGSELLPEYLCHFMKSAATRKRLVASGTGTNIKSLNQQSLSKLNIPYPSIRHQKALVKRVVSIADQTQRLESTYRKKLAALEALKKSLLHEAFRGQL